MLLLAALAAGLVVRAWRLGITVDEPSHLLSAHLYWQGEDRLKPRDMPPLIKIAGGWVPRLLHMPVPKDKPVWTTGHEWLASQELIARLDPAAIQPLIFWSRLPMIFFPLATCGLLWHWARRMFPAAVALAVALAFCLEPTAFAHGSLFKNDLAATFGYLLFWYQAWRYWRRPSLRNAAWLGVGLMVALLAKLSMLILIPLAVLITIARRWRIPYVLALALIIPYVGILAAYQFETRMLDWSEIAAYSADPAIPAPVAGIASVLSFVPIPSALWEGVLSLLRYSAVEPRIYLLGDVYPGGHWAYFLVALAVKVPAPLQVLILAGLGLLAAKILRRKLQWADAFWILPPILYVTMGSLSSLQHGIRLILPALPFGLLIAGVVIERLVASRRMLVLAALFVFLAFQVIVRPHPMSFFNVWSGGPGNGLKYLADSNIDWGQNLPALAEFVERNRIPRFRLFYFGNDNPFRFFDDRKMELLAPPWGPEQAGGVRFQPQPGYYAVSATLLPGYIFDPPFHDYFEAFRRMEPVGRAGYSIFVYKIP